MSKMTVGLIDYGAGNLMSITNALKKLRAQYCLVNKPEDLENIDAIILPGVGNFGDAMEKLEGFRKPLLEAIGKGIPFLGLCLGIQIVFESSDESPGVKGLGLFKGQCRRLPSDVKTPHMGWNTVNVVKESSIFTDIDDSSYFYFVHSYYPEPSDDDLMVAQTEYGLIFPSVIRLENVYATQFHPEKSGELGLKLLNNFLKVK